MGAACPIIVHLPPADGLCGVVPHTPCIVYPMPSGWVFYWLAHASGLQWPSLLGIPPPNDYIHGVFAHPGQPSTPDSAHSQAAGLLYSLLLGTTCTIAGYTISSSTWPPSPCHQGLGCYLSHRATP